MIASAGFAIPAQAQSGPIPPTVSEPQDINLGETSFVDGFSRMSPGWTYLPALRYGTANSIKDGRGHDTPAFNSPEIDTVTLINHLSYTSTVRVAGATLGINAVLPVVHIDTEFGQPGARLAGGGTRLADLTIGPTLQFDPVMGPAGPVFVQRVEFDVILPTGHYDRKSDLNQSSGYYSINPYWAATLFPAPGWEISWRLHYLYNFKNTKPASSVPTAFQGAPVNDTQAGQASWLNFAGSYGLTPTLRVGINGYYFKQITDSKVNGVSVAGSREQVFGIGPGLQLSIDRNGKHDSLWINSYTESSVRNRSRNKLVMQARYAYEF
ncbi:phenol degradation protein meta [Massilia sp. JS1662]|nr:phenol degradation protein meta [Massilia sp. JS1662]